MKKKGMLHRAINLSVGHIDGMVEHVHKKGMIPILKK